MKPVLRHVAGIAGSILVVSLTLIVFTCVINTGSPKAHKPSVIMVTLDPSLTQYEAMWKAEIGRRFDNAVGILVHGGDFVEGQWIVGASFTPGHVTLTKDAVEQVMKMYPGRTVVLLACNPGHLNLGIPGVYHSTANVWCVPDRALTPEMFQNGMATSKMDCDCCPCHKSPTTEPSTQPSEDPETPHDFLPSPYDPVPSGPRQSRWQEDPDVVGNIYEFVTD
jgi:hypothetical protein